jgi:hypothetical protein
MVQRTPDVKAAPITGAEALRARLLSRGTQREPFTTEHQEMLRLLGDHAEADRLAQLRSVAATMLFANSSGRERNG